MEMLEHRFFRYFPPEHAKRLARTARRVKFPARRIIFEEDDASDAIYLVLSGRVEILKHSIGEHYHTLAYASENDYFGELGVLDGSGRSARALTLTKVTAALLPRRVFLEVLSQCPWETTMGLFMHVIANLRETDARFVEEVIRKEKITLIGEMANSILHDFRSPVTSIRLALGSISKHADHAATRQACETVNRQLRRMSSMVEDVLQYARGDSRLDRRPVSMHELFADLLSLNADALRAAGVTVQVRAANLIVVLDHDRMIRVLQNLLSNAIEAIGHAGNGIIVLSARARKGACVISMHDNGHGLPKVIWSTLFQPFTTYGKAGGTGLGLAIAKGIVNAHGGEITFESKKDAGTTFHIRLPLPA
ncbi:MAG: ATP-binding protein [Opitutaceae bacterium]|nr:ATP-binding protein [Opitutaceae bacterium]